jgi:cytochrome c oxidase subunit 3
MASSNLKGHPYHLVDPSPWPFVGALSAFILVLGGILFMHQSIIWLFVIGVGCIILTMLGWWREVIKESTPTNYTIEVRSGLRFGVALFIISEVVFFGSFFWAYFNASLCPTEAMGNVWPPVGIVTFDPFGLPYLNTLLLLLSGTMITWAHHSLVEGHIKDMISKTGYGVILGFIFLMVQAYEYRHTSFSFTDGIYPSTFFMATGFHGFHVFIGAVFLTVCWFRARRGGIKSGFTSESHVGFEAAAWYWHFVDVVWLFLFVSVYWWGSGS